jgi:catechol 2,3-dioxygenase-like lactoylglutathione lyase family enzyme
MIARMSHHESRPVLLATEAHLYVRDIAASVAFFTGKLGFEVDFLYGEPPFYGQVKRDGARFALRVVCEPVFVGDIRERESLLSASVTVATPHEIEQLFADFQARGVAFHKSLGLEPWGAITFIVRDPDGNLVLFAGPGD